MCPKAPGTWNWLLSHLGSGKDTQAAPGKAPAGRHRASLSELRAPARQPGAAPLGKQVLQRRAAPMTAASSEAS